MTSMISPTGAADRKRAAVVKMLCGRAARMGWGTMSATGIEASIQRVADVLCSPETIWIPRSWLETFDA